MLPKMNLMTMTTTTMMMMMLGDISRRDAEKYCHQPKQS